MSPPEGSCACTAVASARTAPVARTSERTIRPPFAQVLNAVDWARLSDMGAGCFQAACSASRLVHPAHGPRVAVVDPAQIVLRVVGVREAGELQFSASEPKPVVARDPLLARVVDADAEQLAVVGLAEIEIVAHGISGSRPMRPEAIQVLRLSPPAVGAARCFSPPRSRPPELPPHAPSCSERKPCSGFSTFPAVQRCV